MILKTGYNGTITEYSYDSLNRLIKLVNKKSSGEIISSFTYTLGPAGNRIKVDEVMLDMSSTITYTYDKLYRLIGETRTGTYPYSISYTYDNVGNRLTKTQDGITTTYTYDENDRLIQENTPEATITYTYDNNGNTIEKRTPTETTTYTYDFENRLISATINGQTTTYQYDGDGNRVKKIDGQGTVNYLVDTNNNTGFSQVILETDGTGNIITSYIYGDDLICQTRAEGTYYYHYDGLGSTRNLTEQSENIISSYWYDGFGNLIGKLDQYPVAPVPNNYLFTGEQFDQSLRFYYLRARYYNPEIGRFITTDPVEGNIYEPLSLHKYLYANLDPVNKIDPSGEEIKLTTSTVVQSIITTLVSTIFTTYIDIKRNRPTGIILRNIAVNSILTFVYSIGSGGIIGDAQGQLVISERVISGIGAILTSCFRLRFTTPKDERKISTYIGVIVFSGIAVMSIQAFGEGHETAEFIVNSGIQILVAEVHLTVQMTISYLEKMLEFLDKRMKERGSISTNI